MVSTQTDDTAPLRTAAVVTLGCPRNTVDSEKMLFRLNRKRFIITEPERADVVIINTCGFIDTAKEESLSVIDNALALKAAGKVKKVIVWGCLAKRYHEEIIKHRPDIDAIVDVVNFDFADRIKTTPPHLTYLKIAEGCQNQCAYCAIPLIRGVLTSRSEKDILEEVRKLDNDGATKELIISAQDTTAWGQDLAGNSRTFKDLLTKIARTVKNIPWIRVMYAHPRFTDPELIDIIAAEPRVVKYIDLPVQHINDRLLHTMNRHAGREKVESILRYIKDAHPNIAVRTSIICGFPTETKAEFEELLDFMQDYRFRHLGAFVYSKEENTPAAALKQLPDKVKRERHEQLMLLQQEISAEYNRSEIGKTYDVIIDSIEKSKAFGRISTQAHEIDGQTIIKLPRGTTITPGTFVKANIIGADEYDLTGKLS
jgi:ribosomal protein S12 methylthiotransferase